MALTQDRAEQRAHCIKPGSIFYNYHICLQKGDSYSGYAQILFDVQNPADELVLDFKGKSVSKVTQNGQKIEVKFVDGFIHLEAAKLAGTNKIGIHYCCNYGNDGNGCVSFVDVDEKQYIYTQFESYYANRVIPCFDQPDLKAKMRLAVISPSDWKKVLSNETASLEGELNVGEYVKNSQFFSEADVAQYLQGKEGKMTIFPETKLLPTYLYCFIAGCYLQLKLDQAQRYKNIPMSLFSIESLYQPLKRLAPFIFEITIESMKFYEKYFNYPFSFNKYDQIFVHQYRWGAMENAGVVTFNDLYLFKDKVPVERMLGLATTISHELAHHWFGNLVTMRWWDDLWLNQAFATFISYWLLQKLKNDFKTISYQSSMSAFFTRKGRGYHQDQMITTHPIRCKVINTSVADSIFDGITYSKGAATMKQFFYLMGEENFGKALSEYFHKYQWKNATIDDFLAQMQKYFDVKEFSLKEWKEMWLQTSSLNLLEAKWDPSDTSENAKMIIKQGFFTPEHQTYRVHKIKVGHYLENGQADVLEVLVWPKEETVVEYNGSKNYKAVLLNYEDHGYLKNTIDPTSLEFLQKNIHKIQDNLSRALIWSSFYQMIRDARMTSHKYVDIAIAALPHEVSDGLLDRILDEVHAAIDAYTPEKYREELNGKVFKFVYEMIGKSKEQTNRLTILKTKLVNFATADQSKKIVISWMKNKDEGLQGVEMTVGLKWRAVAKAFALKNMSNQEKQALFQQQKNVDSSDTSKRYRHLCDALKSTEEQYEQIYQNFISKDCKHSVTLKGSIASGWNHPYHRERLQKYKERYFKDLQGTMTTLDADHHAAFYNNLAPFDDDLEFQIEEYSKIKFPEGRQKNATDILKMIDNLKRRQRAYQLYQSAGL